MATYEGKQGIEALKNKIKNQSNQLLKNAGIVIMTEILEESPVGYTPEEGSFFQDNDPGRFKNSWNASTNDAEDVVRQGDEFGGDALSSAEFLTVELGETVIVSNSVPYNIYVEELGWTQRDFAYRKQYDIEDKPPYAPVQTVYSRRNKLLSEAIRRTLQTMDDGDDAPF